MNKSSLEYSLDTPLSKKDVMKYLYAELMLAIDNHDNNTFGVVDTLIFSLQAKDGRYARDVIRKAEKKYDLRKGVRRESK